MTAAAAARLYLALTAVVVLFHLCLILGAPWGHLTMGGRWAGALPAAGRATSAASILTLGLCARAVAERAGLVRAYLPRWAIWAVLAFLTLGAVMNAITPSAPERLLWLPQILVQLALVLRVARSG